MKEIGSGHGGWLVVRPSAHSGPVITPQLNDRHVGWRGKYLIRYSTIGGYVEQSQAMKVGQLLHAHVGDQTTAQH